MLSSLMPDSAAGVSASARDEDVVHKTPSYCASSFPLSHHSLFPSSRSPYSPFPFSSFPVHQTPVDTASMPGERFYFVLEVSQNVLLQHVACHQVNVQSPVRIISSDRGVQPNAKFSFDINVSCRR